LHFFLKAQDQYFAVDRWDFFQRLLYAGFLFSVQDLIEWRFNAFVFNVEFRVLFGSGKRVDALRLLAAVLIEHKISCDCEKPGLEFPFSVVLVAALEYAKPGFLEKIFGPLAIRGEVQQVAEQAELILFDQMVELLAVTEPGRNPGIM